MSNWIALFRGINVGGNNVLPMKELRDVLESIGCTDVQTYIQSGNALFGNDAVEAPLLAARISDAVLERKGFKAKVFLQTLPDFHRALRANPFRDAEADPKSLHLFFLGAKPEAKARAALDDIKAESEQFLLTDRVLYLHAPAGIARSKLAVKAEKILGVDVTARNWRTVIRLAALADRKK